MDSSSVNGESLYDNRRDDPGVSKEGLEAVMSTAAAAAEAPVPPPDSKSGCACRSADPVQVESAWERISALRAKRSNSPRPPDTLDLRIFCGTWNVAARVLDSADDIGEWLDVDLLNAQGEKGEPPDMFVVGFQEVVELTAQNVVMDSFVDTQSRANSLKWFTLVYAFLAKYGQRYGMKYTMLSEQRLLGTYLLVMVAQPLCSKIRHVQSTAIATGLGGILGNKGAVAVRMEVGGSSSVCFVCVHMAAHRENVLARNAEYRIISTKPVFADTTGRLTPDRPEDAAATEKRQGGGWAGFFSGAGGQGVGSGGGMSPTRNVEMKRAIRAAMAFGLPKSAAGKAEECSQGANGANGANGSSGAGSKEQSQDEDDAFHVPSEEEMASRLPKTKTVLEADIVFWLGDLNYRISDEVPDAEVFELVQKDDLETLRRMDQLNLARSSGAAFQEFQEGPLCFAPTYKYIPGTRDLDNRPEKKTRCPSWCDRVLYSVGANGGDSVRRLALDRYWSCGPLLSDHMTVSALFRTSLLCAKEEIIQDTEIEAEPLSPIEADAESSFDSAPFPRLAVDPPAIVVVLNGAPSLSETAYITNTGGKSGRYHLCADSCPEWMSLDGSWSGELQPGEKVQLSIVVDTPAAETVAENRGGHGKELHEQSAACAVLRVEVDGGGAGTLLPVVCMAASDAPHAR